VSSVDLNPVVFIVDDDAAMRDALGVLLRTAGFKTQSFSSADEFLQVYSPSQPGCLILDVRMPGMDGLELQKQMVQAGEGIPIIFLSGHGEVPSTARAFKMGAIDFLQKPVEEEQLLDAISRALESDRTNRQRQSRTKAYESLMDALTPRERDVLNRIVSGMTTKQIAAEFRVSNQAVDAHRLRIFRKARVENVAALVRLVMEIRPTADPAAAGANPPEHR